MKILKANLNYFVESSISTLASEDSEYVDITYMAEGALKDYNDLELTLKKLIIELELADSYFAGKDTTTKFSLTELRNNWEGFRNTVEKLKMKVEKI